MNYRPAFITLVLLLFSYVLIDNKLQCKTEEKGVLIKSLALKYGNFNAQQPKNDITEFKKDFKDRFGELPSSNLSFLIAAEELENEAKKSNIPQAESFRKMRGSHFLKTLVREEERSWAEKHPYLLASLSSTAAGFITMLYSFATLADRNSDRLPRRFDE